MAWKITTGQEAAIVRRFLPRMFLLRPTWQAVLQEQQRQRQVLQVQPRLVQQVLRERHQPVEAPNRPALP
jgi:hypothetical protein